jgi:hypothetical protein
MSALPAVLIAAGATLIAASEIKQGQTTKAVYKANANLAELQGQGIEQAGAYEGAKLAREKRQMLGRQKALYAKSGVSLSEGSPLEVMADTATQYEMDIAANRYNTAIQKSQTEYQAKIYRMMGKSALQTAYMGAGATLLSGFGQAMGAMPKSGGGSGGLTKPETSGYATLSSGRKVPVYGG